MAALDKARNIATIVGVALALLLSLIQFVDWLSTEHRDYRSLHHKVNTIKATMVTKEDLNLLLHRFDRVDATLDTLNKSVQVARVVLKIPSFIQDTTQLREYYVQLGKR
jgi:hypothetical protein